MRQARNFGGTAAESEPKKRVASAAGIQNGRWFADAERGKRTKEDEEEGRRR